jgi:hypothetical protein
MPSREKIPLLRYGMAVSKKLKSFYRNRNRLAAADAQ